MTKTEWMNVELSNESEIFQVAVFVALVAVAFAAPQGLDSPQTAQITRYDVDNIGIDGYRFA